MKTEEWLPCLHCGTTLYKVVLEDKQYKGPTEYRVCLNCNAHYEILKDGDGNEIGFQPPLL